MSLPCPLPAASALLLAFASTASHALDTEFSGAVRTLYESASANDAGLLAPANGKIQAGQDSLRGEVSLKGRAGPLHAEATLMQSAYRPGESQAESRFNELYWSGQAASWHFTLGKKIVSWDVGQGFRPLDVIQQENRRALYGSTLEGARVAMAEHYDGDAAWALVLANPFKRADASGRDEAAGAIRYYRRAGSTDWHAVARWGRRTGYRAGLALAWVATDALELHASVLRAQRLERITADGSQYHLQTAPGGWQSAIGLSWTTESQLSLLAEYWRDNRALRSSEWASWRAHASGLPAWLPAEARSGSLADLAGAFGNPNQRRDNVLIRTAWTNNVWSPALDVVYTPADRGRVSTLSLAWQGNVIKIEGGIRRFDGPRSAIVRNLPERDRAYLWLRYPF